MQIEVSHGERETSDLGGLTEIDGITRVSPDLIVEVTQFCDHSCNGCYAPLLPQSPSMTRLPGKSEGCISCDALTKALAGLGKLGSIGLRGGEPTLHPQLPEIVRIAASHAETVFLHTHGRWLLDPNRVALLDGLRSAPPVILVSYDEMHRTTPAQLTQMINTIELAGLDYRVCVTEPNISCFKATRHTCDWIADERFVFLVKAFSEDRLPKPKHGVVNVDGMILRSLSVRSSFRAIRHFE